MFCESNILSTPSFGLASNLQLSPSSKFLVGRVKVDWSLQEEQDESPVSLPFQLRNCYSNVKQYK